MRGRTLRRKTPRDPLEFRHVLSPAAILGIVLGIGCLVAGLVVVGALAMVYVGLSQWGSNK